MGLEAIGIVAGIAAGAASVASGIYSIVSSAKEHAEAAEAQAERAKEAVEMGKRNAALIEQETQERARRQELQMKRTSGRMKAILAASGTQMSGTGSLYISEYTKEQQAELDWLRQAGKSRAELAKKRGQYEALTISSSPLPQVSWGSIGNVFTGVGQIAEGVKKL